MTRRERAAVVELLRCAADSSTFVDSAFGFAFTGIRVGADRATRARAGKALVAVVGESGTDWVAACLETAQRVEEGMWP